MKKLSTISRITLLLVFFFGLDKVVAFVRQVIIARQFGLSAELDVFNVANNIPDMLFALISGGALAMAFIPVLTEVLTKEGQQSAWKLFSRIANLAFVLTSILAVIVAVFAHQLVRSNIGIAPGFTESQQDLVTNLMRLNLIATIIFSISGLVMAGLQSNNHFLLPAMAPLFYNIGQIFGALILAPSEGYQIGPIQLPALGMGVYGLVYGVLIGAALHLLVQLPGLIKYHYKWTPGFALKDESVQKVLRLMGPRLLTMICIQLIFIVRDNLASRLEAGSVSSLTYGWMVFQVPETLIGTAVATAMLPTLSEYFAKDAKPAFLSAVQNAVKVLMAVTIPVAVILGLGLGPLLAAAFDFSGDGNTLLMNVTRGFLAGLLGQSLVEVFVRSFYSRQDAKKPLIGALTALLIYLGLGILLYRSLDAPGISITDAVAYTAEAVLLWVLLNRLLKEKIRIGSSLLRAIGAGVVGGVVVWGVTQFAPISSPILVSILAMGLGALAAIPLIWKEIKLLARL